MSDLQKRLEFATELAYQAGDIMLKYFQIGVAKENKSDGSPVTIADREVNALVIESVSKEYPNDGVLGEEASNLKEGAEYVWVCDPIDGTIPYTFGIPVSQFSLALVKDGNPVVGVLYDPYMKRLYHAVKGGGAFMNEQRIHVNKETKLAGNFIASPTQNVSLFDSAKLVEEISKRNINTCVFRCFTSECSLVASGQFVGSILGYPTAHDVAAVKIIVEEAGGKVTDLLGNEQRYDRAVKGAIISNGLVHDELVFLVKPYLKI